MNLYTPAIGRQELPPLVSPQTRKKIRCGVLAGHLLLIGVPLMIMSILSWISPPQEKLIVIDVINDLPYNPPPAQPAPSQEAPSRPAPVEPAPQPPVPQPQPQPPDLSAVPLPPSAVDTRPKPKPDPVRQTPPKPAEQPKPATAKNDTPRQTQTAPPVRTQPNLTPISTKDLPKPGGSRQYPGRNDPSKPVNTSESSSQFTSQLYRLIKYRWEELKPNETQLSGRKPKVTLVLSIASDGAVRSAVLQSPCGVAPMDNAARQLCERLKREKISPPPMRELPSVEIILECN